MTWQPHIGMLRARMIAETDPYHGQHIHPIGWVQASPGHAYGEEEGSANNRFTTKSGSGIAHARTKANHSACQGQVST
jgi:hypothetical protein